ncbi:bifunctional diguanylate cyclase/phosphodiesterase [Pseudooceanicola sp.]|uniref:putative bifunctional diguanylate cyclase/phosphodiesterase n=1 Tax=Pseudooceanicola sp. TaxID=1914328 RepID=UPI00260503F6|nr:bifunctional diguanylate cyclase/phosphodiesterase [Pseudooceanicola sp.]MDF1856947.1 bifunctional diguanylate cyclase/phosphodiesterase [Pseudooceanicola sp.]
MSRLSAQRFRELRRLLRQTLLGPQALAFLPAIVLAAFWIGGEPWLILVALIMPALYALTGVLDQPAARDGRHPQTHAIDLPPRKALESALDQQLDNARSRGRFTACFLLSIDDFDQVTDRYGLTAGEDILTRSAERLRAAIRGDDSLARFGTDGFGIGLAPIGQLDLEIAIQMAARLQSAIEDPISLGASVIYVSCSVGFCLSTRAPEKTGPGLILAAELALADARRNGPSAIRAYSADMTRRAATRTLATDEVAQALNTGQILPFFQPQVSTDTGRVTGFEALARWCHPERGVIPPVEFLPVLERMGAMEHLSEVILTRALTALQSWDRAGLQVPHVGVNFASAELQNPRLIDAIRWQIDRFELSPERLVVEVLETVVAASPDDVLSRNINGLAELGCQIDLDDFGTGHASISSIRRFAVSRIKIDRSFVMKVDRDPEQQKMVSAILTMAERLELETLAEGIETRGEHAMLAQLGCGHVQGFGIARPMPVEQTIDWVRAHEAGLSEALKIGRGIA